jgi:CubicO group peptidase (beta-lactamase class C family)
MSTGTQRAGLSLDRLAHLERFFRTHYIDTGKLPGIQMLVQRRGELVFSTVLGLADREQKRPLAEDAIFRLYSMSKPITSVALMMLVERGLVTLDDPVRKFIPEWRDQGVFEMGGASILEQGAIGQFVTRPPPRPMQVVDLLRHTSGLTYGFQQRSMVDAAYRRLNTDTVDRPGTTQEMVRDLAAVPLDFAPGTAWNYSISTDVLGHLVWKISGQPLDEFFQEQLFAPLGMTDTGFYVPQEKLSRFAPCYALDPKAGVVVYETAEKSPFSKKRSYLAGGGGLVGTAADYLRFCQMLANGGSLDGVQILSPKTVELMTRNHLPGGKDIPASTNGSYTEAAMYAGVGFGLGFSVVLPTHEPLMPRSVGSFAWGGAAGTFFWVDPAEELVCVFMAQLVPSNAHPIHAQMRELVYSAFTDSNVWPHALRPRG